MAMAKALAAVLLLGVVQLAIGAPDCVDSSTQFFGAPWDASLVDAGQESDYKLWGALAGAGLLYNKEARCVQSVRGTYGPEVPSAATLGLQSNGSSSGAVLKKELALGAGEVFDYVEYKADSCIRFLQLTTNKGRSLAVGDATAELSLHSHRPAPGAFLGFFKATLAPHDAESAAASAAPPVPTEGNTPLLGKGALKQLQLVWVRDCATVGANAEPADPVAPALPAPNTLEQQPELHVPADVPAAAPGAAAADTDALSPTWGDHGNNEELVTAAEPDHSPDQELINLPTVVTPDSLIKNVRALLPALTSLPSILLSKLPTGNLTMVPEVKLPEITVPRPRLTNRKVLQELPASLNVTGGITDRRDAHTSLLGKVDGAPAAVNATAGMSGIDAEFTAHVVTVGPSTCLSGTSATLGVKTTNTNSSPDKWFSTQGVAAADVASYTAENKPKLNEATVFHSELTHSDLGTAWTMKIGRGGQIYSLSTPELGELIPKQRVTIGQWMDEVFQHVLPMPPQKLGGISTSEIVDGDIHQAGMYVTSDVMHQPLLSHSVYSPLFAYQHNPCENKVDYITWPLHAHHPRYAAATTITVDRPVVKPTSGATPDYAKTCTVQYRATDPSPWETCTQSPCNVTYDPNNYRQNLVLMHQTISDLDDGVIQIDLEINKWGGSVHEGLQGPWAAFRTSTVPVMILSKADGTYEQVVTGAADPNCPYLSNGTVGNWVALMNENSPAGKGIGLVFGNASSFSPADAPDFLSWISYGKDDLSGTVLNVGRKIYLVAGESLWLRYFLVLGDIAHIQAQAKALRPCNIITKQKRNTDVIEKAGASLVCFDKTTFRPVRCRPSDTTLQPIFKAFRDYVSGAKPLFMLEDRTRSRYVVTTNPYFVSYDPTDNKTAYLEFLGWALPSARASYYCSKKKDPNCAQDLTTAFGAMTSKPIINVAANLRVLTLTSKAVPSDSSAFTPAACIPL